MKVVETFAWVWLNDLPTVAEPVEAFFDYAEDVDPESCLNHHF